MSLLGCDALHDSLKTPTTLTLVSTVSARFELTDIATGNSTVKEYASTALTRTWTREASNTPYEIANTVPAAGKFRLVNGCCCWKCRWTTIIRSVTNTIQPNKISGDSTFDAPWTLTEIAFTGDPPVITTGTSRIECDIIFDFPPDGDPKFCMADTETGRTLPTARFILSGITGSFNYSKSALDWSYTDGEGGTDTGGPTSTLALPTSGSLVNSPIDGCVDMPDGWVQIDFTGDESDASFTDTTTASLRLEFAFS